MKQREIINIGIFYSSELEYLSAIELYSEFKRNFKAFSEIKLFDQPVKIENNNIRILLINLNESTKAQRLDLIYLPKRKLKPYEFTKIQGYKAKLKEYEVKEQT